MAGPRSIYMGPRLKRMRRELGLTQADMANDLEISPSYIALLERNQRPLTADLILHVRDISHPDSDVQKADVEKVLDELGIDAVARAERMLEVWNKADLLDAAERQGRASEATRDPAVVLISAATGDGIERLLGKVAVRLSASRTVVELPLDYGAGEVMAWLHRHGEVLDTADDGERLHLKVALAAAERAQLARLLDREERNS